MQKTMLYIRTALENTLLWIGGVAVFALGAGFLYDPFINLFGRRSSAAFYVILTVLTAALVLWILAARRKELGERIATAVYILLNLIPMILIAVLIMMWLSGLD